MMAAASDQKLQALLELERRGELPDTLKPQLDMYRQQGLAKPLGSGGKSATEDQGKSASYYERALRANANFIDTAPDTYGMQARGPVQEVAHDLLPTIENAFVGAPRQKADQATREFVAATLRRDSGAAISESEFANQYATYFPQNGDSQEV